MWFADGTSLYDKFGFDWTLLQMGETTDGIDNLVSAAKAAGMPLQITTIKDKNLRDLYEADLALIRPDQVVAWRGTTGNTEAEALIAKISGK